MGSNPGPGEPLLVLYIVGLEQEKASKYVGQGHSRTTAISVMYMH